MGQVAILAKIGGKSEDELSQVEKDIIAAKARSEKFNSGDEAKAFRISDELKRRLRAQRFGPLPTAKRQKKGEAKPKSVMEEIPVDDVEQKKRAARAARFGGEPIPMAEEPAAEEPAAEEPATEEPAAEEPVA